MTYNTYLKLCATLRDGPEALRVLEEMPLYHLKPDLISLNTARRVRRLAH